MDQFQILFTVEINSGGYAEFVRRTGLRLDQFEFQFKRITGPGNSGVFELELGRALAGYPLIKEFRKIRTGYRFK